MADVNTYDPQGISTDANVAANWSQARVPTGTDIATFNGTAIRDCNFSGNISCGEWNATAAFSKDIELRGNGLTTAGDQTWAGGGEVSVDDSTVTCGGNFDNSGQFGWGSNNLTEIHLNGAGAQLVTCSTDNLGYLHINGGTVTLGSDVLARELRVTAGDFDAVTFDVTTTGDMTFDNSTGTVLMGLLNIWTCGGNFDNEHAGTWTQETSTLILTGTGNITTYFQKKLYHVTLTNAAVYTVVTGELQARGTFTIDGGDLVLNSGKSLGIETTSGKLICNGTGPGGDTGSITGEGSVNLYSMGDMPTLNPDYFNFSPATLRIYRPVSGDTYAPGGGWNCDVLINDQNIAGSYEIRLAGNYDIEGNLTFQTVHVTGTLFVNNVGNPNINVAGDIAINENGGAITYTKGAGTITLDGTGAQALDLDDRAVEAIVIDKASGTVTFTAGFNATSFTATTGTLDFTQGGGFTFETAGAGDFTISSGANVTGSSLNANTFIVGGNFSASGSDGDLLDLVGTATWTLTVSGTAVADYVDVAYGDADAGTYVSTTNSLNSSVGNTFGWAFMPQIAKHYNQLAGAC